jgi:hypothetical protein
MSSRPRSGSVGQGLRQEVHLAQHGIPGDNAYAGKVAELRARVLAAARTVDPALPDLLEDWENSALSTRFYLPPGTTTTLAQASAALQEEFAGAATAELAKVELPGAKYRSLKETAEVIAVNVFAKAVKRSLWGAAKAAAPWVMGGLFMLFLLWVIW